MCQQHFTVGGAGLSALDIVQLSGELIKWLQIY